MGTRLSGSEPENGLLGAPPIPEEVNEKAETV
jgi:hypothetical protein